MVKRVYKGHIDIEYEGSYWITCEFCDNEIILHDKENIFDEKIKCIKCNHELMVEEDELTLIL